MGKKNEDGTEPSLTAFILVALIVGSVTAAFIGAPYGVLAGALCGIFFGTIAGGVVAGIIEMFWRGDRQTQSSYTPTLPTTEANYLGNKKTRVFHCPDCYQAQQISYENEIWFESVADGITRGYEPCKLCNPESEQ